MAGVGSMAAPAVDVARPSSSMITRLRSVACLTIYAVSCAGLLHVSTYMRLPFSAPHDEGMSTPSSPP